MTTENPLRAEMQRVLGLPKPQRDDTLLLELVAAIVTAPRNLPPLPRLGLEHAERLAQRMRDPKAHRTDSEVDARVRLLQWERWYALISEALLTDGIHVMQLLSARGWWQRLDAISARVESQARALRELGLPWWPVHRIEREPYRELTLLDFVEQQLGKLNSASLRSWGAGGDRRQGRNSSGGEARPAPAPRRDVDDFETDDWQPSRSLL